MRLDQLIADSGAVLVEGAADIDVRGLTSDSRAVKAGALFAAMPGQSIDGATFVAAAVRQGAVAVLCRDDAIISPALARPVSIVRAKEPRRALARIAANFYPRQPATIVAVTGTNGKTSIAEFTRQIFSALGLRAASLGTLGVVKPDGAVYGSLTTPDPITLHATLQQLADEGVTHLVLEASSHGLDQFRLDGVRLAAGGFNNLGRDHLDYHPTVAAYLEAKLQLFKRLLQPGQPAVVNVDGAAAVEAIAAAEARGLRVASVGRAGRTLRGASVADGFAQRLTVEGRTGLHTLRLDLLGDYQASNALVAAGLAIAVGCDEAAVIPALARLTGVKGRLEVVARHNGGITVVDYAHKPEALAACLDALRPFATGKLICVFGCGGNRDKGKRPIMGEIAARKCDVVIVTDDNPRNEQAAEVRRDILAGVPAGAGARIDEVGDRAAAIRTGVERLGPGDVLLVAGKGHETGQIVGPVVLPFSDHEEIARAIRGA